MFLTRRIRRNFSRQLIKANSVLALLIDISKVTFKKTSSKFYMIKNYVEVKGRWKRGMNRGR